jgi:hypothetical protein
MERRRSPRTPLAADVEFRRKRETRYTIAMHDLSAHGARISSPERVIPGETVWVQLPSLQSLCSRVTWSSEWQSGIEFERPMHAAVFDMIRARLAPAND